MKPNKPKTFILIAAIVLVLDQLTKYLASSSKINVVLIKNFLSLTYTTNTGAGFGILKGQVFILILFSLIVLGLILYYYKATPTKLIPFVAMIFGGALGNLIDRIMYGYVVDFISFSFWPAFNVADVGVTIGVLGLVWFVWKG